MCHRIVESIMIKDGSLCNAEYHNRRIFSTCINFFGKTDLTVLKELSEIISTAKIPHEYRMGIVKCRFLYDFIDGEFNYRLEYAHYYRRSITSLKLVEGSLDYSFKYTDRSGLDELMSRRGNYDDIIIVKNGLLTDASAANIVLLGNGSWYTPAKPLLEGTARARLIEQGSVIPADIEAGSLCHYRGVRLINAMLPFEQQPVIPISAVEGL